MTPVVRTRAGMSLIEVILAMAIMMLALVAIGKLVDVGLDRSLDAQFQTRGTLLAESKLAEVEAGVVSLQGGSGGSFEEAPEWSWSVEATPSGPANLYQVTVRVSRSTPGRPFEVRLTQLILDPSVVGSAAQAEAPTTTATDGSTTGGSTTTSGSTSSTGGTTP